MIKLGLIGSGIAQSRMPQLQVYLGEISGVEVSYRTIDTDGIQDFCLSTELEHCADAGYRGLNITHPYKQRVIPLVKPMPDYVPVIGSMNTLLLSDVGWKGATTDYTGFKRGYQYGLKGRKPGSVLIAGAGGVGRAIAFALGDLGAEHLYVYDTDRGQSARLVEVLQSVGYSASVAESNQFAAIATEVTGLVNGTPLGMHKYPGMAFPKGLIGEQVWAFDAVYTPLETDFIATCRNAGLEIMTGYDLWFFQGLDAFELYTGIEVDCDLAKQEALSWLG